ncbi:MAG: hypothetical protein HY840_07520, partial [Bacteroidetes bacterium]|nr:hypothetical protein [Bacteroidota bacterium]
MRILNSLFRGKLSQQTQEESVRLRALRKNFRDERNKIWTTSVSIYAQSIRTPDERDAISAERDSIWNERVRTYK